MTLIRSEQIYYRGDSSSDDSIIDEARSDISSSDELVPDTQYEKIELLKILSNRINLVMMSAKNELEKDLLKTCVELNLSHVLGIYTSHYKTSTPLVKGYMPSQ